LISNIREDEELTSLKVHGWGDRQYYVVISGVEKKPKEVRVRKTRDDSDQPTVFQPAENQFHHKHKLLTVTLEGKSEIQIR